MSNWLKLSKNVYRKEVLPVGKYRKDSEDLDFEITLDTLNHVNTAVTGMLSHGVKIPLVKNHDGDSAFGQVIGAQVENDSLFCDIEFTDETCRSEAMRNDVSAFIPPEFVDGKGNAWKRPLRHLAITPYPVIPGLGTWNPIAASFHSPEPTQKESPMLEELIGALELSFDAKETQEVKEKKTVAAVQTLVEQSLELADEVIKLREQGTEESSVDLPAGFVSMAAKTRKHEIEDLLLGEKITPHQYKGFCELFCDEEAVTLSLSEEGGQSSNVFDKVMNILKSNKAVKKSGKTLKLAHGGQTGDSPLVKAAKARTKSFN